MPPGSRERAQQLLNQGDIYDLTGEIAVIQTHFTQTQEMMAKGDPFERWPQVVALVNTVDFHWKQSDERAQMIAAEAMTDLKILVRECSTDRAARKELKSTAALLATLQEKQAKMENLHAELIPMNKMKMLFAALTLSIYEGIPDDLGKLDGAALRKSLGMSVRRMFSRPEIPERTQRRHTKDIDAIDADFKLLEGAPRPGAPYVDEGHFGVDSKELSDSVVFDQFDLEPVASPGIDPEAKAWVDERIDALVDTIAEM